MRPVLDLGMAKKKPIRKKKTAKVSKPARKTKLKSRAKMSAKTRASAKAKKSTRKRPARSTQPTEQPVAQIRQGVGLAAEAGQSGDVQGLSDIEDVDSESVSELVEEGNTFEAGAVEGVERADDSEGKEVRTREFPEDDVPEEYLDQD